MKAKKKRFQKPRGKKSSAKKTAKKASASVSHKVLKKKLEKGKISARGASDYGGKYFRRRSDFYFSNGKTRFMLDFEPEKLDPKIPYRRKADFARCEKLSDGDLVKIIIEQNPEAYKILFKRYEKSLYIYIFHMVRNKEEVEDLLQNVFSKTFKSLKRFDIERKFSSWIYRIAHNEAVNFIKRKSKRKLVSWEDVSTSKDKLDISVEDKDVSEILMQKEVSKEIDDALKEIPEKYRKILAMRYFEEYSYEKIGKILGKPVNTVGTLINRAKKKLFEVIRRKRGSY